MKAILLYNHNSADRCLIIADSAIGRDAVPLFLPEGEWTATPLWAFRIGRLGKSVSHKFALRYVDSFTVALLTAPAGAEIPAWVGFMDSALTPGRWLPAAEAGAAASVDFPHSAISLSPINIERLEHAIECVTEKGTIKTGDIIVLPAPESQPVALATGTIVTASVGDTEVLHLKIK